jgi:two-component system CheB/CheR fusion protein
MEDQSATNEELQSANEEILSTNEELQSTNEELETAKEELQSTNEELVTLNEELVNRNAELSDTNADLSNILTNSQSAIVIVSASLKIRRLTPNAAKLLNIGPGDIGRTLTDFSLGFPIAPLEEKLKEVIQNVSTVEFEDRNRAGHFFSIRIKPFKTTDNRIDGAVATFVDIDDLKRKQIHIESTQKYSNAIIQTIHDPLVVLNRDLRVQRVNEAFFKFFKVDEPETIGKLFYELGNGQWDIRELRDLLEDILPLKSEIEDYKVTHDFESIGTKTMAINARRLEWEQQKEVLILLAIREVTEPPVDGSEESAQKKVE